MGWLLLLLLICNGDIELNPGPKKSLEFVSFESQQYCCLEIEIIGSLQHET